MKTLNFIIVLIVISVAVGCSGYEPKPDQQTGREAISEQERGDIKEALIKQNQIRVKEESNQIAKYVGKSGLRMKKSDTGLYYLISKAGQGPKATMLSEVSLKYKVSLLNGTYCYSSDSTEILNLIVGQSNEPSGLQEGLLYIPEGSIATIIIPSYLAYGLTGDGDKIPGSQSLIYEIELLKVRTK
jgi:FKBP-type peptidyl-prolyl cis-trans isomerase